MKRTFGSQVNWRDLDVMQMAHWPNAPRRGFLALLAVLLCAGLMAMLVWPKFTQLQSERAQIAATQAQIHQALRVPPNILDQVPPVRMIRHDEEAVWLADLATTARERQLTAIAFKTQALSEERRKQVQEDIQRAVQENARLFGQLASDLPMDWLKQTALLNLTVQGSYADILAFVSDLGAHDEWLAIQNIELEAVGHNQVRWSVNLWYCREEKSDAQ